MFRPLPYPAPLALVTAFMLAAAPLHAQDAGPSDAAQLRVSSAAPAQQVWSWPTAVARPLTVGKTAIYRR